MKKIFLLSFMSIFMLSRSILLALYYPRIVRAAGSP